MNVNRHNYWQVPLAAFLAFHVGFNIASFVFIYFALIILRRTVTAIRTGTFRWQKVKSWSWFMWNFAMDMVRSNFVLAVDVLTIHTDLHRVHFVMVPIDDLSDPEIVLLSHRITLTPGTLACGITEDRKFLVVHAMYNVTTKTPLNLRLPIDVIKYGGPRPS